MAYMFPGNLCPSGYSGIPVTMNLPDNLPQSIEYQSGDIKIYYRFIAQVVPVYTCDVTDEDGSCSL